MLVFSWVKKTAELVPYEALYLVHSFVNNFHKYCLKLGRGTRPGHCACRYAIGSALVSLALNKTCTSNKSERLPGRSGQVGFQKDAY